MSVTTDDLEARAEQLRDALDIYARLAEDDRAGAELAALPEEIGQHLRKCCGEELDSATPPGVALATEIKELYLAARQLEATYVEQARNQERTDWERVVAETASIRKAAQRVHAAGFEDGADPGESEYALSEEMCPAALVSMNAGSSPVTFEDRVARYEAFASHFDVSPEVVYYPGSGHDVSLSAAFPESRVVYADVDAAAMVDLDHAGYETVRTDATAHELETEADVLVFQNAGLLEEPIVRRNLRADGWVLANDHLESAEHVAALETVNLVGVIPENPVGDGWTVDTSNLDAYLSRTESETESADTPNAQSPLRKGTPLDTYVFRSSGR
jgi:hypothetical protein